MFGAPLDLRGPHVLGDNGLVHEETVALFAEIFAGLSPGAARTPRLNSAQKSNPAGRLMRQ